MLVHKKLSPFALGLVHFQSVAGFCGAQRHPLVELREHLRPCLIVAIPRLLIGKACMREWSCAPPSRGMSSPCHHRFGTLGCEGEHFFTNFLRTIHSSLMTAVVQLECEYPGVNRPPHRKVPLPESPSQFGNIVSGV